MFLKSLPKRLLLQHNLRESGWGSIYSYLCQYLELLEKWKSKGVNVEHRWNSEDSLVGQVDPNLFFDLPFKSKFSNFPVREWKHGKYYDPARRPGEYSWEIFSNFGAKMKFTPYDVWNHSSVGHPKIKPKIRRRIWKIVNGWPSGKVAVVIRPKDGEKTVPKNLIRKIKKIQKTHGEIYLSCNSFPAKQQILDQIPEAHSLIKFSQSFREETDRDLAEKVFAQMMWLTKCSKIYHWSNYHWVSNYLYPALLEDVEMINLK